MDREAFQSVARVERHHWFFVARRRIIRAVLERYFPPRSDRWILDIGPGTGTTLELLDSFGIVVGAEYASDALPLFREISDSHGRMVQASATQLPFRGGAFDLITAFDVLEHIADDRAAVGEIRRALRGEGTFFCSVPAHPWLWSDFDEYSHHHRRYTAASLRRLLAEADLCIERMFYMNSILFVPIVLVRIVRRVVMKLGMQLGVRADSRPRASGLGMPPAVINRLLTRTFGMEARWAPHFDIPFGLTLVCIARKK